MDRDDVKAQATSANTRKAYTRAWAEFEVWCAARKVAALEATPDDVAEWLVFLANSVRTKSTRGTEMKFGTLTSYVSGLTWHFKQAGLDSPTHSTEVKDVMSGLRRIKGTRQEQVMALLHTHIKDILAVLDAEAAAGTRELGTVRDAAMISLGFACAMRRSEIVALNVDDIEWLDELPKRAFVHIRKSKTDQAGEGQKIPVIDGRHIQPLTRLERWLDASGIVAGPLFQTMRRNGALMGNRMHSSDVPRTLKEYAGRIGLPTDNIAGHSLRAGFVTSAAGAGASVHKIMDVTRHKSADMVMKYIRDAETFKDHAGDKFL